MDVTETNDAELVAASLGGSRDAFGQVGLNCVVLVTVVNLRLDVCLATNQGVSVAEIHQIYPMWLVPLLSVSVALWIGLLLLLPVRKASV